MKYTKYLSKAYFKIKEIDKKHKIFNKKNQNILEIGSGNGGITQYILEKKNVNLLVCLDKKLSKNNFKDNRHIFIKCDIFKENIINFLKNYSFDTIISDVCTNISGIKDVDSENFKKIFSKIYPILSCLLKKNGNFIFKFFNIRDVHKYISCLKFYFYKVKFEKLFSSKNKSSEFYSVCKKYFYNVRF